MALCLGTEERLDTVAPTSLKDAEGRELDLATKVTTRCFGLPYAIRSDGLVLKPKDQYTQYYPLPAADQVAQLQAASLLPKPLPAGELRTADHVFGHALWLLLVVIIVYGTYAVRRDSDKPIPNPDGTLVIPPRMTWSKSLGVAAVMSLLVWGMIVGIGFVTTFVRNLLLNL